MEDLNLYNSNYQYCVLDRSSHGLFVGRVAPSGVRLLDGELSPFKAFISNGAHSRILSELVPGLADRMLNDALAINKAGEILVRATALDNPADHIFLVLRPQR